MSHFYASMRGNRGEATRCGTKQGMSAHIRGWNAGIYVECQYDETLGRDVFTVYKTGGSHDAHRKSFIVEV